MVFLICFFHIVIITSMVQLCSKSLTLGYFHIFLFFVSIWMIGLLFMVQRDKCHYDLCFGSRQISIKSARLIVFNGVRKRYLILSCKFVCRHLYLSSIGYRISLENFIILFLIVWDLWYLMFWVVCYSFFIYGVH